MQACARSCSAQTGRWHTCSSRFSTGSRWSTRAPGRCSTRWIFRSRDRRWASRHRSTRTRRLITGSLSGDGRTICDAATVSNYVALVDRSSLRTRAIIPVGDQPADAQTSTDGQLCLVTNRGTGPGGDTLSVISYRLRREVARLPMGQGAQELIVGVVPDAVLRRSGFRLPVHHRAVRRRTVHRGRPRRKGRSDPDRDEIGISSRV